MAVFTTNNLYPGTIDTAMPGFDIDDGGVKVYFDFSPYNDPTASPATIKQDYIQVTLRYQDTNLNALADPSEIVLKSWENDDDGKGYYFTLENEDLEEGAFNPYQYYKLQFRLTDAAATNKSSGQTIDQWLNDINSQTGKSNLDESSEWSTVCLIRGITDLELGIVWPSGTTSSGSTKIVPNSFSELIGQAAFTMAENGAICTEFLKSVRIQLYDNNNTLLRDSGEIYSNYYENINQFKYEFKYNFLTGSSNVYHVKVTCTTNTLYVEDFTYNFYLNPENPQISFTPTSFTATANEEEGFIKINLVYNDFPNTANAIALYRASAQDNYTTIEKIYQTNISDSSGNKNFYDISIESGILYKYYVNALNTNNGKQSAKTVLAAPIGVTLNHIFLNQNNKQLKIKFNPSVSSMKTIYSENKTETLGSRYPFIKRNGATQYRTFPISGLISYFMDDEHLFTSRPIEYGSTNINDYNTFNQNYEIFSIRDYTYERLFRERVREFLEKGDMILFRSPTEGNILIRLMEISFSPNQTNGRMIWSFSATAYEMDSANVDNFNKYGIKLVYTDSDFTGSNQYNDVIDIDTVMPAEGGNN